MDNSWIMCNSCGDALTKPGTLLFILSPCKHVLCKACLQKSNFSTCAFDNKKIAKYLALDKHLPPYLKSLFDIKGNEKALERAIEADAFQREQLRIGVEFMNKVEAKFNNLVERRKAKELELSNAIEHYIQLRDYRRSLQAKAREIQATVDDSGLGESPMDNETNGGFFGVPATAKNESFFNVENNTDNFDFFGHVPDQSPVFNFGTTTPQSPPARNSSRASQQPAGTGQQRMEIDDSMDFRSQRFSTPVLNKVGRSQKKSGSSDKNRFY